MVKKNLYVAFVRDIKTGSVLFDTSIREVSLEKAKEWDSYKWLESLVEPGKTELTILEGRDMK